MINNDIVEFTDRNQSVRFYLGKKLNIEIFQY